MSVLRAPVPVAGSPATVTWAPPAAITRVNPLREGPRQVTP